MRKILRSIHYWKLLRPICWVFGHKYEKWSSYGVQFDKCSRCEHSVYPECPISAEGLAKGEFGHLYGMLDAGIDGCVKDALSHFQHM